MMKITEAPLSRLQELKARRQAEKLYIVLLSPTWPKGYKKSDFDAWPTELAPGKPMWLDFLRKREKNISIKEGQRHWGTSPEDREFGAKVKAFTDAFGNGAIYYKRSIRNNDMAGLEIARLRKLAEEKTVVLVSADEGPPSYRYVLMQLIGPWPNMVRMFVSLRYSEQHIKFAKKLEYGVWRNT